MSPQLVKNIKWAEAPGGWPILKAYQDPKGIWTIGYGRNLQVLEITASQAEAWLNEDICAAIREAEKSPSWKYLDTQARRDALIELVYNMGPEPFDGDGYKDFKNTMAAIARKDWKAAAAHLLDSKWRQDVGPARSNRIAKQLETGEY